MPQDRFLHPRFGQSHKVGLLTDFEFRVWITYLVKADDYGVMRCSGVTMQEANDVLARKPHKVVERALQTLVNVGLLLTFEHQGRRYVCQGDWQDFQKVRYPSKTSNPLPTPEIIAQCSRETSELFSRRLGNISEIVPQESSRARTREEAKGIRLTANGERQTAPIAAVQRPDALAPAPSPETGNRARQLLETFGALYTKYRRTAFMRLGSSLQWVEACTLCDTWDDATLTKLIEILLTTDDEWVVKTDRGWKVFVSRAQWCAERLAAWEARQAVAQ